MCTDSSKKTDEYSQPIHLQLAQQQGLRKELARAEGALQKLGNLAALINQMTVQSLVMITQQDVSSFLNNVMKVTGAFLRSVHVADPHGGVTCTARGNRKLQKTI